MRAIVVAMLAALPLVSCQQVKDASDFVDRTCEQLLSATPEVKAKANVKGIDPLIIAHSICILNDAGREIWQLFEVQAPDGRMMAAPQPQLEAAKTRALAVARQQGILQ